MKRLKRKKMTMMKIKMLILVRLRKNIVVIATKNMEEARITKKISMRRRDVGISIKGS